MSASDVVSASTAMISDATEMSKPVSRVWPSSAGPQPTVTRRRCRSHTSSTRCHVTVAGSMFSRTKRKRSAGVMSVGVAAAMPSFAARRFCTGDQNVAPPFAAGKSLSKSFASSVVGRDSWNMRVSSAAAQRFVAAVIAWMSPVRCRLNSSMGITCA